MSQPASEQPLITVITLPDDIILYISQFFSFTDALVFVQVCKALHSFASLRSYWYPVLAANRYTVPLCCSPYVDLHSLHAKDLHQIVLSAARVARARSQTHSSPTVRLKHISKFTVGPDLQFLSPPIPGTFLVVLYSPAQKRTILFDYRQSSEVNALVGCLEEYTSRATDMVAAPGTWSFAVWTWDVIDPTLTKLVLLTVKLEVGSQPAHITVKRSTRMAVLLHDLTYPCCSVAFNSDIILVALLQRRTLVLSILVISMTSDPDEVRLIETNITYGVVPTVTSINIVGNDFCIFFRHGDEILFFPYSISLLTESPSSAPIKIPRLKITSPKSSLSSWCLLEEPSNPDRPCLFISLDTSSFSEITIDEMKLTQLPFFNLTYSQCNNLQFIPHRSQCLSASGTTHFFSIGPSRPLALLQYDIETGQDLICDLELPYGEDHPLTKFGPQLETCKSVTLDDTRGELLILWKETLYRLTYLE